MTIRQNLKEKVGREVSIGALYSTAERLEKKGLLSSKKGEAASERGGKAKRYFSVTPLGMSALNVTKKQLETLWSQASVNFSIQVEAII